jgi:ParB family chromosome partitioning protein
MPKNALGRGLNALFEGVSVEAPSARTIEVEAIQLIPNRYQPRKDFDGEELRSLTESIRRNGLLQPVVVRRIQEGSEAGRYELIAGERRWRAAQAAGLERIPAVVREATDDEMLGLALIENLQRADLNPIEAARAYRRLAEEFNLTQEEIAQRVGKDRSSIANLIRLLALPPDVQESVRSGRLSLGHAKALLSLPTGPAQTRVARQILKASLSVRQTELLISRFGKGRLRKATSRLPLMIAELEQKLKRHLATMVRISPRAKGGSIAIQYHDPADLERIAEAILSSKRA